MEASKDNNLGTLVNGTWEGIRGKLQREVGLKSRISFFKYIPDRYVSILIGSRFGLFSFYFIQGR